MTDLEHSQNKISSFEHSQNYDMRQLPELIEDCTMMELLNFVKKHIHMTI
jgi:hypothetical protein